MIGDVFTYYRARLAAIGRRNEHYDALNWENIPKTILDRSYHLEMGETRGISNNQDHQAMEVPVTLRLPLSPDRRTKELRDTAIDLADEVLADFLKASNRTLQTGIKNVQFNTMAIEPLDESNDNGLILRMVFTALVFLNTRG